MSKNTTSTTNIALGLELIHIPPARKRKLHPGKVRELAESMRAQGQLQPIIVRPLEGGGGYELVAGWHRYEAGKKLRWKSIRATVLEGLSADQAELVEIDENLVRSELSSIEHDLHVARRKELYEKLHPDTKKGATGKGRQKSYDATSNGPAPAFIDDAAQKTGKHRATIARAAARGAALAQIPNATDAIGTSLDKPGEVEALMQLSPDKQQTLINVRSQARRSAPKRRSMRGGGGVSPKRTPPRPQRRPNLPPSWSTSVRLRSLIG
jgi:ParB family chromosome partitioning protein